MSNRLASFRGPSTPSSSPVSQKIQPASPARTQESTFHRKLRAFLQELQHVAHTWSELILVDGLKAAQKLADTRTNLDDELLLSESAPHRRLVAPKVAIMERCIADLEAITSKLRKQFSKMNSIIDNIEALLVEAHKAKGWQWVQEEPLWMTWSLERFVRSMPEILIPYHRSLAIHENFVESMRPHSVSYKETRTHIVNWLAQPCLQDEGWEAMWEELCNIEIERWEKL